MAKSGKTAYFLFSEAHRASVKEELLADRGPQAKVSVAEVAKELGKRWKALTDEERSDWQAKSAASKAAAKEAAEAAQEGGIDGDLDAEQQAGQQPKQDAKAPPSSNDTAPVLPLSVVKRLIMLDPDVTRISAEALVTVAYAAELFLGLLTSKMTNTCHQASRGKRRTLKLEDFTMAVKMDRRLVEAGLRDVITLATAAADKASAAREEARAAKAGATASPAAGGDDDHDGEEQGQPQGGSEGGSGGGAGAAEGDAQPGAGAGRKRARRSSAGPGRRKSSGGKGLEGAEAGEGDQQGAGGSDVENQPAPANGKGKSAAGGKRQSGGGGEAKKGAGQAGKGKSDAGAQRITAFFARVNT